MHRYFIPILLVGFVGWTTAGVLFFKAPPTTPQGQFILTNISLMFVGLWMGIASIGCFISYYTVKLLNRQSIPKKLLRASIRRGCLLATAITGTLFLKTIDATSPLNLGLLLIILILVEFSFYNPQEPQNPNIEP